MVTEARHHANGRSGLEPLCDLQFIPSPAPPHVPQTAPLPCRNHMPRDVSGV